MTLLYDLKLSTIHYMPILRKARFKNMDGVERWRKEIFDRLRATGKIPPNLQGLPTPAAIEINNTPLPSLRDRGELLIIKIVCYLAQTTCIFFRFECGRKRCF